MKKALYLLVFTMSFGFVNAQHIGVEAGSIFSSMAIGNDVIVLRTNMKPGFLAGVTLDIPIDENMLINFGVGYKTMGTNIQNGSLLLKDTVNISSISTGNAYVTTSYAYLFRLDKVDVFLEAGGYMGYAVSAKRNYTTIQAGNVEDVEEDLVIGNAKTDDIKALDVGVLLGAGVYVNQWKFSVGYQFGLNNLNPAFNIDKTIGDFTDLADPETYTTRNGMVNIKAAFLFNRK